MSIEHDIKDLEKKLSNDGTLKTEVELKVDMKDGSEFLIKNPYWMKALDMKLNSEDFSYEDFTKLIRAKTDIHWRKRTVPTKFGNDEPWEESIRSHLFMDKCSEMDAEGWKKFRDNHPEFKQVSMLTLVNSKLNFERNVKDMKYKKILRDGVMIGSMKEENNLELLILLPTTPEAKEVENFKDYRVIEKWVGKEMKKYTSKVNDLYKNQAELANVVCYHLIRGCLIGVIMSDYNMVTHLINNDGMTRIRKGEYIKVKT